MNPEWLCYVNGQEFGPYTWPQLVQMAAAGNVVPQTYVRRNFDSQWYLAEQVPNLFAAAPAGAAPRPAAHPTSQPRPATASGVVKKPGGSKSGAHPATAPVLAAPQQGAMMPSPMAPSPMAPVAPAPAMAAPAIPQGVPKGKAVVRTQPQPAAPSDSPQWIPTGNSSPSVKSAGATDDALPHPAKKDNTKTMVIALGGAIAGVAILGGLALIWKFTRPPVEPTVVATAPVEISTTETNPQGAEEVNPAAEVNPAVETPKPTTNPAPSNPKTATTPAKSEPAGPKPQASNAATATLVKSVTAWKPVERFGTVGARNGLSCTKLSVYLAANSAGRKVGVRPAAAEAATPMDNTAANVMPDPAGTAAEGTPPIAAPAATNPASSKYVSAEAAPYLFVEMTIKNSDTKPLVYIGWNSTDAAAVLIDPAGQPFKLLPAAATPNVPRQVSKEVPPGSTVQDTLVFEVPPTADLSFRLVLPRPAFSTKLSGAWGYEINGASLAAAAQVAGGDPAGANPASATPRSSVSVPIPGLQEPLPAEPAPQPAPQPALEKPAAMPEPEKKPEPRGPIPIPGLTDVPDNKPAGPKKPEEVPNLAPPPKK